MKFVKLLILINCSCCWLACAATKTSFNIIDDVFETDGANHLLLGHSDTYYSKVTNNGQRVKITYDFLNYNNGLPAVGKDGIADTELIVSTTGFGTGVNNYSKANYTHSLQTNATGLKSEISGSGSPLANPQPTSGTIGTVGATYVGLPTASVSMEFRFIAQYGVTIENIGKILWSSSNTSYASSIVFEWSAIQLLNENFQPFSELSENAYIEDRASVGWIGMGTKIANGDTLQNVGTDSVSGLSGSGLYDDSLYIDGTVENFAMHGILANTKIGGVRFTHNVTDTRGIRNDKFTYTSTVSGLELNNFIVFSAPEPSTIVLMSLTLITLLIRRQR